MELNDTTTILIMTLHVTTLLIMTILLILNMFDITYYSLYLKLTLLINDFSYNSK